MSLLDRLLPEPDFVVRDPAAVTSQLVSQYEELTGKTLYPAQVERILIDVIAYRESLMRETIQDAAKLNLVRYSRAPILDYLGENVGVKRLDAVFAHTTLRFTFNPAPTTATLLPKGTVVEGGEIAFATIDHVTVPAGVSTIDAEAKCTQLGVAGNGFVPEQIKTLASELVGLTVEDVQNVTTSAGGAQAEADEHYQERIVLAPEQFSNAGSRGAYRFHALSAHPEVIDVAVVSPSPGVVNIYPLVKGGLPSTAVKTAVQTSCNADKVRPLTDEVNVLDPQVVDYSIIAKLIIYADADPDLALEQAQQAAENFKVKMQAQLGRDVVRDELIALLKVYGVYSVGLVGNDIELNEQSWPRCTSIDITIEGSRRG